MDYGSPGKQRRSDLGHDTGEHTLIFLFLHLRHPARDFLWERRGGMAAERFGGFHVSSTSSRGIH